MGRFLAIALLALAACSSEGAGPITGALMERVKGALPGGDEEPKGPPPIRLTRAMVDQAGTAMIRGGLLSENARSVFSAVTENRGFVTYASRFGQSLTLHGSLITGTRGMGRDLLSVTPDARDPLVVPTPVADWPASIGRRYVFPGNGPQGRVVEVRCRYTVEKPLEMEIVEVTHTGFQVREDCVGPDIAFQNQHFADGRSGFVWRSQQWIGDAQGTLDLEIVEPYTGG
ncbi:YjbF family lipoprotein [Algicella marina]|uniref:YjbF family lipoprotein n=1 Tax=Algicella marina TaxID=2683284 RepID=A0A6P1T4J6_9RHOB|nr:YjbF family lipoprotein [Algicella marina]QHQ36691.1 hypothetical protein GO499_16680 [Algicella marina]